MAATMADASPRFKNHLLAALPPGDFNQLWPHLRQVTWPVRQILYNVGDPMEFVYFIEDGLASIVTVMADGATSEVGMIGSCGIVGASTLFGAAVSAQHVVVQIPGSALQMNAALCRAVFNRCPAFHARVLRFVNAFLNLSAQTAACNALHSVEQRCARWLLMASDRIEGDTIPMTHELLSSMLGVRRSGITVIAQQLQHSGLIRYRHGSITIVDRYGLEGIACECYQSDHERFQQLIAA